eukprot:757647-Hanusia_phi.AAC.1
MQEQKRDVQLVPISIDYEHAIEMESHVLELLGQAKVKESFGAMIRAAPRKLMRSFGKVRERRGGEERRRWETAAGGGGGGGGERRMDGESRSRLISKLSDDVEQQFLSHTAIPPASMAAALLLAAHPGRKERGRVQEEMSSLRNELLSRNFHVLDGGNISQDMQSAMQVLHKYVRTEEEDGKSWLKVEEEGGALSIMALHYLRSCLLSVFAQDGLILFSMMFSSPPPSSSASSSASSSPSPPRSSAHPVDRLGGVWVSREEVGRRYAQLRAVWENEVVFKRGGGREAELQQAVVLLRRKKLLRREHPTLAARLLALHGDPPRVLVRRTAARAGEEEAAAAAAGGGEALPAQAAGAPGAAAGEGHPPQGRPDLHRHAEQRRPPPRAREELASDACRRQGKGSESGAGGGGGDSWHVAIALDVGARGGKGEEPGGACESFLFLQTLAKPLLLVKTLVDSSSSSSSSSLHHLLLRLHHVLR